MSFIRRFKTLDASVIIVSYNGTCYLEECLSSLNNELGEEDEVIIVDNASTDGSAELVHQGWPQVTLICNEMNLGFAAACNQGATLASGRVLVFLNQDTIVAPGWLAPLVEAVGQDGWAGLATSKILLMKEPDRVHLCGQDVHYTGLIYARGYYTRAEQWKHPEKVNAVSGASFAIARDLWQRLGGFDETYFMYYEETDLSWRARSVDCSSYLVPESVVYHHYQSSRPSYARLYYSYRNRLLMYFKNWSLRSIMVLAPAFILADILMWGDALSYGWSGIKAKTMANLFVLLHPIDVFRAHREIQSIKVISDRKMLEAFEPKFSTPVLTTNLLGNLILKLSNFLFTCCYRFGRILI